MAAQKGPVMSRPGLLAKQQMWINVGTICKPSLACKVHTDVVRFAEGKGGCSRHGR